jgi:hypothetical protein
MIYVAVTDRVPYDVDRDKYKPDKMRAVRVAFVNGAANPE